MNWVTKKFYLKSEDGFGEVNTVLVDAVLIETGAEVVLVVLELFESVVVDAGGGGVHGGVVGGVPPIFDDDTTVSSMGTGFGSWSLMFWRPLPSWHDCEQVV